MKNGYKILWTPFAINELRKTIIYLEENWTIKEISKLTNEIEDTLFLLSHNPFLFQASSIKKNMRRVVIARYNTLYYRIQGDSVEIISFFSNRQGPQKRKI